MPLDMRHEARRKKNKRFGELSLVYGSPRAAICVASSDCLLWKVDRVAFNFPLAQAVNRHNANVMTVVNYLQKAFMDSGERNVLSKILRKKQKKAGEIIMRQGYNGISLFFGEEGRVQFISDGNEAGFCDSGGSFGEIALLYDTPRAATCLALTDCELWMVNREAFQYLLDRAANLQQNSDSMEMIPQSSPGQDFNTSTFFKL